MNASRTASRPAAFRLITGSALAVALLAGCAGAGSADRVSSASGTAERGVSQAERSVEQQPGDASLRVSLGQVYMKAGRFESAISAFNDALELGDQNPRTALSLALANVAIGRNDEAVAILNDWQGQLQAADAGLAYALAGEARRGTAMLIDAARSTAPTAQTRQNLAYSLALEGRWREARVVMSQDLAPELISERIGTWAELTSAGNPRLRIAAMLGAPVRDDAGQPQRLALVAPSVEPQAATPVEAAPVETRGANATFAEETSAAPAPAFAAVEPAPVAVPAPVAATPEFAAASVQPGFVSMPVIQAIPATVAKQPQVASTVRAERKPASPASVTANGTHVVQLGSFTSEESARRAWGVYTSRNAALRGHRMTIIPATVNGKSYWRVAAGGFDAGSARSMCGSIKSRGGACLAYASSIPAPADRGGPQMARRR